MANQITPNPSVPSQVVAEVKFPKFINNLGIIPTSYKDSMSYYECLAWLCKFLEEQVIPTVNENGEAVEELQALYIELNSYVAHYFDTLDVQEEINNKLDDMVEAGTLQEIIADYLNSKAVFGFDTVSSMKSSTNLINGSYAHTLGYNEKNDGGASLYKIRNRTFDDVVDEGLIVLMSDENLVAELIITNNEIKAEQFGCYGDGETDDSSNLNKLLATSYNIILDKNYSIKSTLVIENSKTISGKGTITSLLTTGNIVQINSDDITIKDIKIIGDSKTNDSSVYGTIYANDKDNIVIDNVKIIGSHCGGINFPYCSNCKIINCYIYNVYSNGIFFGGNGADNNIISYNKVDTTRTQNGIFITASPDSSSTTNYIYNNIITFNEVSNANDTGIESGIHSVKTIISNNKVNDSTNPLILIRDTKDCIVSDNYLYSSASNRAISVTPQSENYAWLNNVLIKNNVIKGHFTDSGIGTQQSGVSIINNKIEETATGVRGIMLGGSLSNIYIENNNIVGTYTFDIDFNYAASDITLTNITVKNIAQLNKLNVNKVTFVKSLFDLTGKVLFKDSVPQYGGFFLYRLLNGISFVGKISIKSSDGEEYGIFMNNAGTPTDVVSSTNLHYNSSGFSGWSIAPDGSDNRNIMLYRRGNGVTNAIVNISLSTS